MTNEQITKAFENRWRIKAHLDGTGHVKGSVIPFVCSEHQEEILEHIKALCLDFFKTGILIGEGFTVAEDEECGTIIYKHDPVIDTDDTGFETWWNLYQKKRGKEKCMKKWSKLSVKDKQACIAATPAYVESTPDVNYRKDPYTYLHNKSWQDEVYFRNNPNKQRQQRIAEVAERIAEYAKDAK